MNKRYQEEELVEGIKINCPKVLAYLYKIMTPTIYQEVVKNSGSTEDAKDLFQDTMLIVAQKVKQNQFESGNIKGYIRGIARKLWHQQLDKKNSALPTSKETQAEDHPYEKYLDLVKYDQQIEAVKSNMAELGSPCNQVLKQFYYQKASIQFIADQWNWTYDYCKKRLYRCRNKLRELLANDPNFDK